MRLSSLILVSLFALTFVGCAPSERKVDAKVAAEAEVYEELAITPGRYLTYLQYKKQLLPPIPNSPKVVMTPQFILSNECGVCAVNSIGQYFNTPWDYQEIKAAILGTHAQGTSLASIATWFSQKGYKHVVTYTRERDSAKFIDELAQGAMLIPLIYAFRDGFGPNHFVVITSTDGVNFNIVDSRIGEYSEPVDFFVSKRVLVLGQWIAVKP